MITDIAHINYTCQFEKQLLVVVVCFDLSRLYSAHPVYLTEAVIIIECSPMIVLCRDLITSAATTFRAVYRQNTRIFRLINVKVLFLDSVITMTMTVYTNVKSSCTVLACKVRQI